VIIKKLKIVWYCDQIGTHHPCVFLVTKHHQQFSASIAIVDTCIGEWLWL